MECVNGSYITPGIWAHGTGDDTKDAGADKKKSTNRVGMFKPSFLRHNNILQ